MQPMDKKQAREYLALADQNPDEWQYHESTGVWIGPRVGTERALRWFGADGFVAAELLSLEFIERFPAYLANYDPDKHGLTAAAWWRKRVEQLRNDSMTSEESYVEPRPAPSRRERTLVDITPDPLLSRTTDEPL